MTSGNSSLLANTGLDTALSRYVFGLLQLHFMVHPILIIFFLTYSTMVYKYDNP